MSLWKPVVRPPDARTTAGRYAGAAGEMLGGNSVPMLALLNRGAQLGTTALQATPVQSVWQGIKDTFTRPYATTPKAAVTADVVANVGAGVGQETAKDMGFGPAGQMTAGMVGGVAPFVAKGLYDVPAGVYKSLKGGANPHAKIADSITRDMDLDDLALQTAVGSTAIAPNQPTQQRALYIMDALGDEMLKSGGDRTAAINATATRVASELGLTPATIRDWLRKMTTAQSDNPLMLGEYPAVMSSNQATRQMSTNDILDEMARASRERNPEKAANIRRAADPGRIESNETHLLYDTIANSGGGDGAATIKRAIQDRAEGLADMVRHRVRDWSPNGQMTEDIDIALENAVRAGQAAYRNVYDNPAGTPVNYRMLHGLLPRIVERHLNRMGGYNAEQAETLRQAINHLYASRPAGVAARQALPGLEDQVARMRMDIREARRQGQLKDVLDDMSRQADQLAEQLRLERRDATPPQQQHLLLTLEQLQNSRSAIRGMRQGYEADPSKRHLLPIVRPLERDITRLMQRASPEWAKANREWADLQLDKVARELGQNLSDKAGPQWRQQLKEFKRLAPEAQGIVRTEFAQQFDDAVQNAGNGENLAKLFKTPHIREMVRTILGDEPAVDMRRAVRDLNVMTMSKNMMHGSQTADRIARRERHNSDLNALVETEIPHSVLSLLSKIKQYAVQKMISNRDAKMADVLTTPMRDVPAIAEHIARMRQAQELAARYAPQQRARDALLNGRMNAIRTLPGQIGSALPDDKP